MVRTSVFFAPALSLALAFAAASPLACGASASDSEARMLDKMSSEIDKDQADSHSLTDLGMDAGILGASEGSKVKQAETPLPPPPVLRPAPMPTPPLRVVHLAPDGKEETSSDQAPRLSLTNASLGHPPAARPGSRADANPEDPKHAYNAALALENAGHYAEAQDALTRFLTRWPDSPYVADALYAGGQCDVAQGDFASATQAFEVLLSRFPSSRRARDAKLALELSKRHLEDAGDPQVAPKQAAPQVRAPGDEQGDEHAAVEDEDDEHIVPVDEDEEHIAGNGQK